MPLIQEEDVDVVRMAKSMDVEQEEIKSALQHASDADDKEIMSAFGPIDHQSFREKMAFYDRRYRHGDAMKGMAALRWFAKSLFMRSQVAIIGGVPISVPRK